MDIFPRNREYYQYYAPTAGSLTIYRRCFGIWKNGATGRSAQLPAFRIVTHKAVVEDQKLIGPETSSLGNRVAIEYKAHGVHGGLSESIESPANSNIQEVPVLTRQNCGRTLFPKSFAILIRMKA
jgi:hypothetical protein